VGISLYKIEPVRDVRSVAGRFNRVCEETTELFVRDLEPPPEEKGKGIADR
jgi:hypothetical protein